MKVNKLVLFEKTHDSVINYLFQNFYYDKVFDREKLDQRKVIGGDIAFWFWKVSTLLKFLMGKAKMKKGLPNGRSSKIIWD